MATNPQQILNQTTPTAVQPTATQAPTSQAASTTPVSQFPSVGQTSSLGSSLPNLLSTASPGQPTQPGLLGSAGTPGFLGDLPQLQPYTSSLPYLAALERQPQLQLPQYDDATLQAIQAKLAGQQQSNPLLNGKLPASSASTLAKAQSPMSPMQLLQTAGQSLWQQEIVQPVQDYINTWKTDPRAGLLETLGGVAVIGGIIGLEAVTGGAATPFIFAAMAATQAPNLIQSWGSEITNPSDSNLVRAMVSTGAGALAVGSPIRAFKGIKIARNLLEAQVQTRKAITSVDEAASLLVGGARDDLTAQLRTGAPITQQMETLDINDVDALRTQLEKRGANLDEGPAADLLRHTDALATMRDRLQSARESGDEEEAGHAIAEMKKYATDNLRDPMLSTSYSYLFLPSTPYSHVPLAAIKDVEAGLQDTLNKSTNAIYGYLRRMHLGFGLQSPSDMAQASIASIKEADGYDRAAGSPHDTTTRILSLLDQMKKAAGIGSGKSAIPTPEEFARDYGFRGVSARHPEFGAKELPAGAWFADAYDVARDYASTRPGGAVHVVSRDAMAKGDEATGYDGPLGRGWTVAKPLTAPAKVGWSVPADVADPWEHLFGAASRTSEDELILQALEEPDKWKLLSTAQQAYAQKLRDISDMMTVGSLKRGVIAQPLQGRIGHFFTGPAAEEAAKTQQQLEDEARQVYTSSWLTRPQGSRSRFWKAAIDDEGNLSFIGKTRAQILEGLADQRAKAIKGHDYRQVYAGNETQIMAWRRSHAQLLKRHKNEAGAAAVVDKARQAFGDIGAEMVEMKRSELNKLLNAKAPERELVTGYEAIKRMVTTHVFVQQRAMYGEALQAHAHLAVDKLKDIFGKLPMSNWGGQMVLPAFKSTHDYPDVLPETVFGGGNDQAERMGYFLAHPATGRQGDLNYRPALYARGKLANEISQASEKLTSAEHQSGVINALYKVSSQSKRFIMYNPIYHGLNVAGRAIAFVAQDPAIAGSAFKAVKQLGEDPAAYHDLLEEASMAGMVHANQWNVAEQLRRAQREEDGQPSFFGAVRNVGRALDNAHLEHADRPLWAAVDQLQLAGYLYSKQRFLERGIKEFEARRLAGAYANNLGGMVNPMYMSRLWRQMKGMLFFAPSYWTTFLHSVQSVMPGASRLSKMTADLHGGKFTGLAAVPLRAIDNRSRIELVRAQRDWMITYLAATATTMDMMNVMFSGHHLWDNEQGHQWNIDVTNLPGVGGTQTAPSGEVKRAYISAMPLFRQGVDIGNAIGLGHDWGFGHVFSDQSWKQQDALHKTELALGGLVDGVRQAGSTKIGQLPQVAYGVATGRELTSDLGTGTQVQIDRPAALLSLSPGGYQLQRLWKMYQQGYQQYQPGTPQYQQAQQQFQRQAGSMGLGAVMGLTGFPSVYHMGVEKPPIDDSKFQNWTTQRDASHTRMTQYSTSVFQGQMTPIEYARHKHEEMIRMNQLNADTWGQSSPGATLASSYTSLAQQFGLDNPSLSDQDWFERYDAFLPAWQQLLQSASPSTRAAWWDHSTMQWTDADYLEWEARQLRDSLAASIDGQGGNYIRAFQNQLFRLKPTLTVAEYQQVEQSDPQYITYKTMLTEMGRTSPLGAFVSAFSSPFTQTYVPPANLGLSQADAADLAQHTGQTVILPGTAQQLATQAKQIAQDPNVAQAGGQPEANPQFQQQEQQAIGAAQQAAAQGQ